MNKKAFISYSYADRNEFKDLDKKLRFLLLKNKIDSYSFVFDFKERVSNKILMSEALRLIDESDILIVELSYKSIGVGLEAGFAKAKGKKIIYIHRFGSEISNTVDGICDILIEYKNTNDLLEQVGDFLNK